MVRRLFATFPSIYGNFTIVWKEETSQIQIQRLFLSDETLDSEKKALSYFRKIDQGEIRKINSIAEQIQRFFNGEEINFDLNLLDFTVCSATQEKVLLAESNIPRGWVSTYKRIAAETKIKNGSRVVGNSLAKNPFPIFIPCHRAIRTDRKLGGFQGGIAMKRALLELHKSYERDEKARKKKRKARGGGSSMKRR